MKIEEIQDRLERGYTMAIYGTRENIHEQMTNDIKTLLTLTDVSQQRELLLAYNEEVNQCMVDSQDILDESDVNDFLANNCG